MTILAKIVIFMIFMILGSPGFEGRVDLIGNLIMVVGRVLSRSDTEISKNDDFGVLPGRGL